MRIAFQFHNSTWKILVGVVILLGTVISCARQTQQSDLNSLTLEEESEGWVLLFDGNSLDYWTGLGRDEIPSEHWIIEDNAIKKVPSDSVPLAEDGQPLEGGDIMTKETFENFEFQWEWKISMAGNSGVKYNVSEEMSTENEPFNAALGFEYQVLDDDRHEDGQDPTHRTAALYDMIALNDQKQVNPVGEWNHSRIVFDGMHGEHWLNGALVVEYDLNTDEFEQLLEGSKYSVYPGFAEKRSGHIVLQDHTDAVWYRNMKIRRLGE